MPARAAASGVRTAPAVVRYHCRMLTLRRAVPTDLGLIVDFQMEMARESEDLLLDRDVLTAGVGAVLDGAVTAEYWMAEADGRPVGMLMTVPEWSDWRNRTVLWVHSVYVVPGGRRRGVFSAMYERLRGQVRDSDGLAGIRLYVDKRNERAQRVYESLGMTREHYHLYEWMERT